MGNRFHHSCKRIRKAMLFLMIGFGSIFVGTCYVAKGLLDLGII